MVTSSDGIPRFRVDIAPSLTPRLSKQQLTGLSRLHLQSFHNHQANLIAFDVATNRA